MNAALYDAIADEYYDVSHKTSRNFDHTTRVALEPLRSRVPPNGLILEVGAGRGRSGEFLGIDPGRVIQLDSSVRMLTVTPRESCLVRVLNCAESLPFIDSEFQCVTSFLCDPFLGLNFLTEAYRVLAPNGILIATTPAYEWGAPLRAALKISTSSTRFITASGEIVVPSILVPRDQLLEMLAVAGFDSRRITVGVHRLPAEADPISPDILISAEKSGRGPHELEILYSIIAEK